MEAVVLPTIGVIQQHIEALGSYVVDGVHLKLLSALLNKLYYVYVLVHQGLDVDVAV